MKLLNYKDLEPVNLELVLVKKLNVEIKIDFPKFLLSELVNNNSKQVIFDKSNEEQNYDIDIELQHQRIFEQEKGSLSQYAFIIKILKKNNKNGLISEIGWVQHPLFRNNKLNEGHFIEKVIKAPVQLKAPQVYLVNQKMLDIELEYVFSN